MVDTEWYWVPLCHWVLGEDGGQERREHFNSKCHYWPTTIRSRRFFLKVKTPFQFILAATAWCIADEEQLGSHYSVRMSHKLQLKNAKIHGT